MSDYGESRSGGILRAIFALLISLVAFCLSAVFAVWIYDMEYLARFQAIFFFFPSFLLIYVFYLVNGKHMSIPEAVLLVLLDAALIFLMCQFIIMIGVRRTNSGMSVQKAWQLLDIMKGSDAGKMLYYGQLCYIMIPNIAIAIVCAQTAVRGRFRL